MKIAPPFGIIVVTNIEIGLLNPHPIVAPLRKIGGFLAACLYMLAA